MEIDPEQWTRLNHEQGKVRGIDWTHDLHLGRLLCPPGANRRLPDLEIGTRSGDWWVRETRVGLSPRCLRSSDGLDSREWSYPTWADHRPSMSEQVVLQHGAHGDRDSGRERAPVASGRSLQVRPHSGPGLQGQQRSRKTDL